MVVFLLLLILLVLALGPWGLFVRLVGRVLFPADLGDRRTMDCREMVQEMRAWALIRPLVRASAAVATNLGHCGPALRPRDNAVQPANPISTCVVRVKRFLKRLLRVALHTAVLVVVVRTRNESVAYRVVHYALLRVV